MKTYSLITDTYTKNENFWVERNIIKPIRVEAENVEKALVKFKTLAETQFVKITPNGLKTKNEMYRDIKNSEGTYVGHKQVGYTINASTEIYGDTNGKYTKVQLALWVEIMEIKNPFI